MITDSIIIMAAGLSSRMKKNLTSSKINHNQNGFYIVKYDDNTIPVIQELNIIDRASIGKNIAAGVLDPVNAIPIPFVSGANLYYRMFKQGAYTAGLVGGQEAIRYPLDPFSTPDEPIVAIGSSFIKAILKFNPLELIVVDTNENGLAEIVRDLRCEENNAKLIIRAYPIDYANPIFERIIA